MTTTISPPHQWIDPTQEAINKALTTLIPNAQTDVDKAMQYGLLHGGKRLRPLLVHAVGYDLGGMQKQLHECALAIELIHTYTLIHDDLPAMDNDNLRRGQPTCHIAFNEATAILAGDALQTLAFQLLAHLSPQAHQPDNILRIIQTLSHYSGHQQVIAGQSLDMQAEKKTDITLTELNTIHTLKTASLIQCSLLLGALATGHHEDDILTPLKEIGTDLGLAFQIQDDILDVISNEKTLGKQTGQDKQQHKSTYPQQMPIHACQKKTQALFDRITDTLNTLPHGMPHLCTLIDQIKNRQH